MIPVIITPINPLTNAPAVGFQAANISGNPPQVPAAISALPPGSLLRGFVLNRDAAGNPTLRTELGDFLIQSNFFLRIGSDVTVRIDAWGRNFRANIVEVDGKPVSPEQAPQNTQAVTQKAGDQIVRSQWIPNLQNSDNSDGETQLRAVLLNASGAAAQSQGLKEGTPLIVKLFNIQLPTSPSLNTPLTTPQTIQAPSGTANSINGDVDAPTPSNIASAPTALSSSSSSSNIPQQQLTQAYQARSQLSGEDGVVLTTTLLAQNSAATTIPNQAITLTVIGQERDGEAVLQSPFGLIRITSNAVLPTGTQVQATLALANPVNDDGLVPTEALDETVSLASLAQKWTSLTQIIHILSEQNDGVVPANIAAALPNMQVNQQNITINANQSGAGLFLFLAVLGGGDFKSFIGEKNIKLLEKLGHGSLVNKADNEFSMLARVAANPTPQGWNSMFMPVMVNGQIETVRWFTKRDQEEGKDTESSDALTRFIVEVSLSALGDVRLDGFYKLNTNRKLFDLVVRTHAPLDAEIQQDIMDIYTEAQASTGVSGSVVFQAESRFPASPLQEILQNPPDVMA